MTVMEKSEYYKIIYDILKNEEFQKRKYYPHHGKISVYMHRYFGLVSLFVGLHPKKTQRYEKNETGLDSHRSRLLPYWHLYMKQTYQYSL